MRTSFKFTLSIALLALAAFAIPIEHKYDKLFRFFSLTLAPEGLEVPKSYDKKIYFYASDLIALLLMSIALLWLRVPARKFFMERGASFLWAVFLLAIISVAVSPFAAYPLPYIRLLQLLTPIALFSFVASLERKLNASWWILSALVAAALFQSAIAIAQYFNQSSLGLRILSEPQFHPGDYHLPGFFGVDTCRWFFDRFFPRDAPTTFLFRATGTLPHPNVLGGFLSLSILATYPLIFRFQKWKPWLLASLPFMFFALAVTYSRAALFAWGLGSLIWCASIARAQGLRSFLNDKTIRLLALTLIFSASFSLCSLHDQILNRGGVLNYNHVSQGSDHHRVMLQNIALEIIKKNPVFGVGYSQYSVRLPEYTPPDFPQEMYLTSAHNIYLCLAAECGLPSLFAFLLFIGSLLKAALRTPADPRSASLAAMFIAFLFIGFCDFYPLLFQQGKLLFFFAAGLLAAQVNFAKQPNPIEVSL